MWNDLNPTAFTISNIEQLLSSDSYTSMLAVIINIYSLFLYFLPIQIVSRSFCMCLVLNVQRSLHTHLNRFKRNKSVLLITFEFIEHFAYSVWLLHFCWYSIVLMPLIIFMVIPSMDYSMFLCIENIMFIWMKWLWQKIASSLSFDWKCGGLFIC